VTARTPRAGDVIRYAYLWHHEAQAGQTEGVKDRPCAVVLRADDHETSHVLVVPITHVPPGDDSDAVELPAATKRRLGLDDERSWIVVSEANRFRWPGPDVRPVTGQGLESAILGQLPRKLYLEVRDRFVARWKHANAPTTWRSE
jgi:hypothetical protein